ncbi:MAG: hypothetical protein HKL80_11745 [Acidimicrobiales bacterium]|nr:hypothetical protein [Acidimicrobiales bacterium]
MDDNHNTDELEALLRQVTGVISVSWDKSNENLLADLIVTPAELLESALGRANDICTSVSNRSIRIGGIGLPPSENPIDLSEVTHRSFLRVVPGTLSEENGEIALEIEWGSNRARGSSSDQFGSSKAVIEAIGKLGDELGDQSMIQLRNGTTVNKVEISEEVRHSAKVEIATPNGVVVGVARGASPEEATALATLHACSRSLPHSKH